MPDGGSEDELTSAGLEVGWEVACGDGEGQASEPKPADSIAEPSSSFMAPDGLRHLMELWERGTDGRLDAGFDVDLEKVLRKRANQLGLADVTPCASSTSWTQ